MFTSQSGKRRIKITNQYGNIASIKFKKPFKRIPALVITPELIFPDIIPDMPLTQFLNFLTFDVTCEGFKFIIGGTSSNPIDGSIYKIHWIAKGRV